MSTFVRNNYAKIIVAIYLVVVCIILGNYGEYIYLPIIDNLDSNISLAKVFKDNNFWVNRSSDVPFLGGISREILTSGYSFSSLLDWCFSIPVSYAIQYVLHIIVSVTGFWIFSVSINKHSHFELDSELFILFGLFYGMLGTWPAAWLGFSLLPWWGFAIYSLYVTKEKKIFILIAFLAYNTSLLLSAFIDIYILIGFVLSCLYKREIDGRLFIYMLLIYFISAIFVGNILSLKYVSGIETIKILQTIHYGDTAFDALKRFYVLISMRSSEEYHSGLWTVRMWIIPSVLCGVICTVLDKTFREKYVLCTIITGCLLFHFFIAAFNSTYLREMILPFLTGWNFARFLWLSPFFLMLQMALLCDYFKRNNKKVLCMFVACTLPFSILFRHSTTNNYDILSLNVRAAVFNEIPNKGEYSNWHEFYATNLFDKIKNDINYNKEWSVGFFLDPAVLQYNGIHTLDGYYSNYSLDYYKKWNKLIEPALEKSEYHSKYWKQSHGIRAYIYSSGYKNLYDIGKIEEYPLEVNMDVLRELGAKYIFSRVRISNAMECGLNEVGKWHMADYTYTIYVYAVNQKQSI